MIYFKYCPNVYLGATEKKLNKGDVVTITTKYGKENEVTVHNFVCKNKDGLNCYSITRNDGFDYRACIEKKKEKFSILSNKAEQKSDDYYEKSNEAREFLSLGEPIKIGHHSESRHRAIIEKSHNNIRKSIEEEEKAKEYSHTADFYNHKKDINVSMPESIDYYAEQLQIKKEEHRRIKSGETKKEHSFSLPYAKKALNDTQKLLDLAIKLWN